MGGPERSRGGAIDAVHRRAAEAQAWLLAPSSADVTPEVGLSHAYHAAGRRRTQAWPQATAASSRRTGRSLAARHLHHILVGPARDLSRALQLLRRGRRRLQS